MQFSIEYSGVSSPVEDTGLRCWRDLGVTATKLREAKLLVESIYKNRSNGDVHHDVGHIARVLVLSAILSARLALDDVSLDQGVIFASIIWHDGQRNGHDNGNYDHGAQAAEEYKDVIERLYSPERASHILDNIRWHNKPKSDIPWWVWTREFTIMKSADALDLVRLGGDRTITLRTPEAWDLRRAAYVLAKRSNNEHSEDPFEDVLKAAVEIGLLNE